MVASDRISTYDAVHPDADPRQGQRADRPVGVLVRRTAQIVANHLISATDGVPDEARGRALVVRRLEMLPVECVVRGYITGSGWKDYHATGAVSGIALPRACASPSSCPNRSSRPAPRPTWATTRRSTSRARSSWSAIAR